ncbi:DUF6333 family protein [Streptomyces sp. NPDC001661]
MTEAATSSHWDEPADTKVRWHGDRRLTVVRHARPRPAAVPAAGLPAHDPVAAREFAESFGTIERVLDDLGTVPAVERVFPETRSELEQVLVGCWGDVIEITDGGLVHCDGAHLVDEQAEALAERFPDAAVIASCVIDYSMPYGAWKFIHPDGTRVFAAGWDGEDDWDLEGSPADVAAAFGLTEREFAKAEIDLDAQAMSFDWSGLADLARESVSPLHHVERELSVFHVAHTEDAVGRMTEMWLDRF